MSSPLHAPYCPDNAIQRTVSVIENTEIGLDTYRLRFQCSEMARSILPGQFLMLRLAGFSDPLLGRPLALYDVAHSAEGRPDSIDVVYLVHGKLTQRLVDVRPGQELVVWGPLGNGFQPAPAEHLIMVAGGIGQTPFLAMGKEYLGKQRYGYPSREVVPSRKVTLCYGAITAGRLAGIRDFQNAGVEVHTATDDGTAGHHGLVTDILSQTLSDNALPCRIVCCGPEPMMEAVSGIAHSANIPCQVSLETPMACGIGICFTCVAKVRDASGQWDYKRTCVEGPVFDASDIEWK